MRERRYGAKGERACKPNCKFSVSWIIGINVSILVSIWKFFGKKRGEGWCGSAYKYTYNLTYKYLGFLPNEEGELVEGGTRKGLWFFLGFRGLSPRSLTRKPTYNKTCNPTYNPSYCPHTSAIARGGTAVWVFGAAELWSRKRGSEKGRAKRREKVWEVGIRLRKVVKVAKKL